jgi:hypothetical protein
MMIWLALFKFQWDMVAMRNTASLAIGLIALLLVVVAFLPLLGWANWFIVPLAVVGLALGLSSEQTSGRNLNALVIAVGVFRLWIGWGII